MQNGVITILTHCGLVTPYGDINPGQNWQAITWTNVDLSSGRSSGIHLRAILQELHQPPVTEISLKITYSKFCSNLPGANELNMISFQVNLSTNGPGYVYCVDHRILLDQIKKRSCAIRYVLIVHRLRRMARNLTVIYVVNKFSEYSCEAWIFSICKRVKLVSCV